jgi:hypothetical protein
MVSKFKLFKLAHSDFTLVVVMFVLVAPVVVPMVMMVPVVMLMMPTIMIPMSMPALGGAHRSDDPDRIARPTVPDPNLETCAIVRRRHSEDRGRDRDLPLLLGIAAR